MAYDWIHNGPTVPLYQAAPSCGDGNPVAGVIPTPQPCSVLGVARGFRTPYVTNWTLDLQRAITDKLSLEIGYVGNHGTKLSGITDINQPPFVNGISPGWGSPTTVGSPAYNCLAECTCIRQLHQSREPSLSLCSGDGVSPVQHQVSIPAVHRRTIKP